MKTYTAPDGTTWGVVVQSPGASNAMVLFRHPDGGSSRLDRYNWFLNKGPEARSVTARVDPKKVLDQLEPAEIARLFARSIPVSRQSSFNEGPEPIRG
jgi:hypothetical protein